MADQQAKVKLMRSWLNFPSGAVIDRHPSEAKWLIMKGIAKREDTIRFEKAKPVKSSAGRK